MSLQLRFYILDKTSLSRHKSNNSACRVKKIQTHRVCKFCSKIITFKNYARHIKRCNKRLLSHDFLHFLLEIFKSFNLIFFRIFLDMIVLQFKFLIIWKENIFSQKIYGKVTFYILWYQARYETIDLIFLFNWC